MASHLPWNATQLFTLACKTLCTLALHNYLFGLLWYTMHLPKHTALLLLKNTQLTLVSGPAPVSSSYGSLVFTQVLASSYLFREALTQYPIKDRPSANSTLPL